jgi:hypothetical protein
VILYVAPKENHIKFNSTSIVSLDYVYLHIKTEILVLNLDIIILLS